MYTEVSKHLDEIVKHTQKSDLPSGIKLRAVSTLQYLHTQALCDLDRRQPISTLKHHWEDLQRLLNGTNVLDRFKIDRQKWSSIEAFVGVARLEAVAQPAKRSEKESRWKKAEAKDFFEFLSRASETQQVLTPMELTALRLGLYYLEMESKRARVQRDKKRMHFAWKQVQPILRKAGMLDQFETERDLIRRVRSFISDSVRN